MVLSVSILYTLCYALNIIILLIDTFQIIYNIYMKYLIDNVYTPPHHPETEFKAIITRFCQYTQSLIPNPISWLDVLCKKI